MDPEKTAALQALADDLKTDIDTVKSAVAIYKTQGLKGLIAEIPKDVELVKKEIQDVASAVPIIKEGYKTTEFWIVTAGVIIPVIWFQAIGKPLPFDVVGAISGVAAVYAAVRSLVKKPQS